MQFTVLTYNIHRAIGVDRRFAPERIIEILEYYNADIVLLQEVDQGAPRSSHLDLAHEIARALKYDYHALGLNVTMKVGKYGNATLTRFPIGRQRNIDLSIGWRKKRGAQHTCIEIPKGKESVQVDLFNIHLGLSATERIQQIRLLLGSGEIQRLSREMPCIAPGGMNDWRGLLKRQCFVPAGFDCATNRRPGSRWSIKTFPSFAPTGGLDKIFFRGKLKLLHCHRSRLKLARMASDHLPVMAEFQV